MSKLITALSIEDTTSGLSISATQKRTTTDTFPEADVVSATTSPTAVGVGLITSPYQVALKLVSGDDLEIGFDGSVKQIETATIVAPAGATTVGNLIATVTGAAVVGSPLAIPVALLLTDNTADLVATKVRAALNANAAITNFFSVGGTGAEYSLTKLTPGANDGTLNLAHANGTCTGITTASSSANTLAGVEPGSVFYSNRLSGADDFVVLRLNTGIFPPTYRSIGTSKVLVCVTPN